MKVRFTRWYNAVLTALLGLLGYSCSSDDIVDEYGTLVVEYGVPNAHFIMKGTVTDEAGTPIQGIKATLKVMPYQQPEHAYGIDSTMTDAAGKYQIEYHQLLNEKILLLEDVDGAANGGEFQSDTIDISKLEPKKIGEGDGRWYEGKFEIQADVKMKRK